MDKLRQFFDICRDLVPADDSGIIGQHWQGHSHPKLLLSIFGIDHHTVIS